MVRCWIYSAGPDQCQCYNVDDENLADLAAQAQFLEDFRAQRAANPALYRQLLNMLVPAADAIPMRNYTGLPFRQPAPAAAGSIVKSSITKRSSSHEEPEHQCPEPVTERHHLTVPRLADLVAPPTVHV